MTECERCEEEHDLTFRLTNVSDTSGLVSAIHSVMVVCASCKGELEDNEDITW